MRFEKIFLSKIQDLFQFVFVIVNSKIANIILSKRTTDLKFQMENILQNDNILKKSYGTIFINKKLLKIVLSVLQISRLEENDTICLSQRISLKMFKILKNIKLFIPKIIFKVDVDVKLLK